MSLSSLLFTTAAVLAAFSVIAAAANSREDSLLERLADVSVSREELLRREIAESAEAESEEKIYPSQQLLKSKRDQQQAFGPVRNTCTRGDLDTTLWLKLYLSLC